MMEFLEFLNTADIDVLKTLPGITATQAELILAARPFATQEDCKRVKGLTQKRLTLLREEYQKTFEEKQPIAEEPIVEETPNLEADLVQETDVEAANPPRRNYAGRVIAWILVILLLAAAVFAAIKWGIPFIYEKYIKPVENNAAEITDLASQQSSEVARLNDEITTMQDRLTALETRADDFDLSLAAHDETLAQLQGMQELLSQNLATQKSDVLQELSNQVTLTRAIELLSRSRLYLSESNFGLAKTDLQTSRNLLYSLLELLPADQTDALKIVINRVDMALENLPAYPVVAVYDVDTAWQFLVDGLPNIPAQAVTPVVMPPTAEPTPSATADATAESTVEPTAEPTPEVTATP